MLPCQCDFAVSFILQCSHPALLHAPSSTCSSIHVNVNVNVQVQPTLSSLAWAVANPKNQLTFDLTLHHLLLLSIVNSLLVSSPGPSAPLLFFVPAATLATTEHHTLSAAFCPVLHSHPPDSRPDETQFPNTRTLSPIDVVGLVGSLTCHPQTRVDFSLAPQPNHRFVASHIPAFASSANSVWSQRSQTS
ncbi:hypothetical protein VFPPC_15326 [Pochonia chlamydosporia 170]|uniref:Uncharacterized protein n=1 Tax=Pochonia chlamydosporia 170 TaxID=1380566 RepID=A0A179G703_METCM|nr:hypothetical protein VFPPC_15326 [Pochonia chlamydosporia 170]OAQ73572.1 hypothetical protein VFPPC_15326 [Pochonia chlamydosporia 170]